MKYRAVRTEYAGRTYDSKAEAARAAYLDRCSDLLLVVPQPGTVLLGLPENRYRPDFLVVATDGSWRYEDVKGVDTPAFRRNAKLWRTYGPGTLRVVRLSGSRWVEEDIEGPGTPLHTIRA